MYLSYPPEIGGHGMMINSMTDQEASNYLGLAEGTMSGWRASGSVRIPYYKVGKRVFYLRADIEAYLQSCYVPKDVDTKKLPQST